MCRLLWNTAPGNWLQTHQTPANFPHDSQGQLGALAEAAIDCGLLEAVVLQIDAAKPEGRGSRTSNEFWFQARNE